MKKGRKKRLDCPTVNYSVKIPITTRDMISLMCMSQDKSAGQIIAEAISAKFDRTQIKQMVDNL